MIRFTALLIAAATASCLAEQEREPDQPLIGQSAVEAQRTACEERGGDFARHDSAFAHARDHQLGLALGATLQQTKCSLHVLAA